MGKNIDDRNSGNGVRKRSAEPDRDECGNSAFSRQLGLALNAIEKDFDGAAITLRDMIVRTEKTLRQTLYLAATAAYRLAELLETDDELWTTFKDHPFWEGRPLKREDCLRYASLFVHGTRKGQGADTAREHARALSGHWHAHATPEQVFEDLQTRGGFAGVCPPKPDRERPQSDLLDEPRPTKVSLLVGENFRDRVAEVEDGGLLYLKVVVQHRGGSLPALKLHGGRTSWP